MSKIILSIRPEYTKRILDGDKKYEYRRVLAKKDVKTILIYCTHPLMKVVGEVEVEGVISTSPCDMWNRTRDKAGISDKDFFKYFDGVKNANAYILGKVKQYKKPKQLVSIGIKIAPPPQSFQYIK
ncbi:TPA: ASCH domain-containing protein [Campylobacter fetus subsp. venerealis]|nr:ASCH domain-containing protein [Campylobacter fetus subsp. venerealis]